MEFLNELSGRGIDPGGDQRAAHDGFLRGAQMYVRSATEAPRALRGLECHRSFLYELGLLIGPEFHHAPTLAGGVKSGENLAAYPEIGMVHVRAFY